MPNLLEQPGYFFVVATLLPLASFALLLLSGGIKQLARRYRDQSPWCESLFAIMDGPSLRRLPALVALLAIAAAFACSLAGGILYFQEQSALQGDLAFLQQELANKERELLKAPEESKEAIEEEIEGKRSAIAYRLATHQRRVDQCWQGQFFTLFKLRPSGATPGRGTQLEVGFRVDMLTVLMFLMVTFIATLIHLYSMAYLAEESADSVEDHEVHTAASHLHRRGRFGRFFLYLSLFCFSMLHLLLADNLLQVFVSWELVGICSFLLIGFYYERQSASNAANKAFIVNRVGDAGFLIGLLIVWSYLGTFHFESIFAQLRAPVRDAHHDISFAGRIVRADPVLPGEEGSRRLRIPRGKKEAGQSGVGGSEGSEVILWPARPPGEYHAPHAGQAVKVVANPALDQRRFRDELAEKGEHGAMPYWMLVAAGLGLFLGCVGKSAQFPLQVWLPDAMEGPTPVSALIHAATMVAAGVYLVGRCYPLFTPEVLLVIAYTGAITLFVAATIAVVQDDIKKVLAYSTVSQLGFMMLALGVGGWAAGLFHLLTHAFFKALLFLGAGSVILACHHEQNLQKMGGLLSRLPITGWAMLAGVLAIAGTPLFSGWYSKDAILAHALGFVYVRPGHLLLFLLPLVTAGLTTFYMFRLWFLAFSGTPRDPHVFEKARESPWPMTLPLVLLAACSVGIAWGWPVWDARASWIDVTLQSNQPNSVLAEFGIVSHSDEGHSHEHGHGHGEAWPGAKKGPLSERQWAHELHDYAGLLALGMAVLGLVFAWVTYYSRTLDPAQARQQFPAIHALLVNRWYFDHLYDALLVRPAIVVARGCAAFDLRYLDGLAHALARGAVAIARLDNRFDQGLVDGLVNLVAGTAYAAGGLVRHVQTGALRTYLVFLVLATVALFIVLSYVALAAGG